MKVSLRIHLNNQILPNPEILHFVEAVNEGQCLQLDG